MNLEHDHNGTISLYILKKDIRIKILSYCVLLIFALTIPVYAGSDLIVDCIAKLQDKNIKTTYILDVDKGNVEILTSSKTKKGVLGVEEHFYNLYFTYHGKTEKSEVVTVIINRITGELTQTKTSKKSFPKKVGDPIKGVCKTREYKQLL